VGVEVQVASAAYQPEPKAAAAARRFVRDTLQAWVVTGAADGHGLVDDAVLLTSELVTNAVVHAGTPVQVTCRLADGAVEVVVSDGHPGRLVPEAPEPNPVPSERTGGRGLLLPAALASAWGVAYGRASKAVWFRLALDGAAVGTGDPDRDGDSAGELSDAIGVTAALAAALRSPGPLAVAQPVPATAADTSYQRLLAGTVESARMAVGADAAFAIMPDEDGDLRLRASAGKISLPGEEPGTGVSDAEARDGGASRPGVSGPGVSGTGVPGPGVAAAGVPSVITVPFVVDGQVTGLLAAASAVPGCFGEPESARLQRLADRSGPALQRAWLAELERLRRGRIAALAQARELLTSSLGRDEILDLAGRAIVPRLAPWCAVLLRSGEPGLRTCYARHTLGPLADALPWLLDQVCQMVAPDFCAGRGAAPRPGRRWPLVVGDADGAPPGVTELAADTAWCFPLGEPGDAVGVLVVGDGGQDRLPHDVAALAADLACRIGLALNRARSDTGRPGADMPGASGPGTGGTGGPGTAGSSADGPSGTGTGGPGSRQPDGGVGSAKLVGPKS
jgi:anti-sigma regulatory factor (Ser/Thr protein kinase)/GAF domain-containing protein